MVVEDEPGGWQAVRQQPVQVLCSLPRGHVARGGRDAHDLVLLHHRSTKGLDPQHVSRPAAHAERDPDGLAQVNDLRQSIPHTRLVLVVNVIAGTLSGVIPKHPYGRWTDVEAATIRVVVADDVLGVLGDDPEPCLAHVQPAHEKHHHQPRCEEDEQGADRNLDEARHDVAGGSRAVKSQNRSMLSTTATNSSKPTGFVMYPFA